jgi:hypothetical protein
MSRKLSYKQPFSAKILKGLNTVGKKHKIAQIHHGILKDINATHKEIIKQTLALKKNPSELRTKDILENLKSHKQSKERQIQAWIKAKKPTTMEKFENFISEGCSMDEARLPNNIGDITFKNCILNKMRFFPSKQEVRQIRNSIPNLNNEDYRIIILNGHGAIEGGVVIKGDIQNQPTIRQAKNAPVILPKLPNGMWYFAQGYPGTSTMMCKKVDTAQFTNLNNQQKRNNFVRRLFSDGTFQTFLDGKSYDESDTAMVGIPTMPFYNKAWDFGQWAEHRTMMGIYDITDPNYNVNIDATRQPDIGGTYVYPTLSGDKSPSDVLRSHIYFKGTISGKSQIEPDKNEFHHKRLEMIRDLLRKFKTENNRIPTKDELAIITKDITFSFTAYGKTNDYPLTVNAANAKFKRVYRNLLFSTDWAPPRLSGNGIVDPIAKGSDGVPIRQRMIDTINTKKDITITDLLNWFDPNAPNAVDKRKVIFIDWSCQPISVRVQYNGLIKGVDFDTAPEDQQSKQMASLLGFQATRLALEKMARNLNLTFNRVQSLFEEKNGEQELGVSPFTAKIETDAVSQGTYLDGPLAREALEAPMEVDTGGASKSLAQAPTEGSDWAPPFGGRRKKKTRRKRKRRRKRKTRRKK